MSSEGNSSAWEILRIGLAFYDGISNRWITYHEPLVVESARSSPTAYYRDQLTTLLKTVREVLLAKQHSTFPRIKGLRKATISVPEHLRVPEKRPYWNSYVIRCLQILQDDRIGHRELYRRLKSLLKKDSATFTEEEVAYLGSILPVARDWDIYGCLHPMSTGKYRFEPEDYWWRFFCYQLTFIGTPEMKESNPLIGRSVRLNLMGDAPRATSRPVHNHVGRKEYINRLNSDELFNYFEFAKGCSEKKAHPIMEGQLGMEVRLNGQEQVDLKEVEHYRSYAAFIDTLQQDSEVPKGSKEALYAVYPVIACGYYHFFHVLLRPPQNEELRNAPPVRVLQSCFDTFSGISAFGADNVSPVQPGERLVLKESLREILVQIRLSAFDHLVGQFMHRNRKRIYGSDDPDEWAVRCFCQLAPMINEMRAAIAPTVGVWSHYYGSKSDLKRTSKKIRKLLRENVADSPVEMEKFDVNSVLRPWTNIWEEVYQDHHNLTKEAAVDLLKQHVPPVGNSIYREAEIQNTGVDGCVISLWLFHNDLSRASAFDYECFWGTNQQRLQEQYDLVRDRMLRFWNAGHA